MAALAWVCLKLDRSSHIAWIRHVLDLSLASIRHFVVMPEFWGYTGIELAVQTGEV